MDVNTGLEASEEVGASILEQLGDVVETPHATPYLQLLQEDDPVVGGLKGSFVYTLTSEVYTEPEVVFLWLRPARRWHKGKQKTGRGDCYSHDGRKPELRSPAPQGIECRDCKHRLGTDDEPPACSEEIWTVGVLVESQRPFVMVVRRTGLTSFRRFLAGVLTKYGRLAPPYAAAVQLGSMERGEGKMSYMVPLFRWRDNPALAAAEGWAAEHKRLLLTTKTEGEQLE